MRSLPAARWSTLEAASRCEACQLMLRDMHFPQQVGWQYPVLVHPGAGALGMTAVETRTGRTLTAAFEAAESDREEPGAARAPQGNAVAHR